MWKQKRSCGGAGCRFGPDFCVRTLATSALQTPVTPAPLRRGERVIRAEIPPHPDRGRPCPPQRRSRQRRGRAAAPDRASALNRVNPGPCHRSRRRTATPLPASPSSHSSPDRRAFEAELPATRPVPAATGPRPVAWPDLGPHASLNGPLRSRPCRPRWDDPDAVPVTAWKSELEARQRKAVRHEPMPRVPHARTRLRGQAAQLTDLLTRPGGTG
jgi:hypothetical protein